MREASGARRAPLRLFQQPLCHRIAHEAQHRLTENCGGPTCCLAAESPRPQVNRGARPTRTPPISNRRDKTSRTIRLLLRPPLVLPCLVLLNVTCRRRLLSPLLSTVLVPPLFQDSPSCGRRPARLRPPRPTKVKPPRRNPSSGTGPGKPRARVHDRTCAVPGRQSVGTNSGFRLRAANASQLAFSLTRTLSSPSPRLPAAPRLRRTGRRAGRGERGKGGRDALHRRVKIAPLQHWRTSRQWHITEHGRNRQCSCGHAPPARLAFAGTHDDT